MLCSSFNPGKVKLNCLVAAHCTESSQSRSWCADSRTMRKVSHFPSASSLTRKFLEKRTAGVGCMSFEMITAVKRET